MKKTKGNWYRLALWASILIYSNVVMSDSLVETVAKVKPSVVGIGVYSPMATISNRLDGSGFVVGNGKYVVTNEHVINVELEEGIKSTRVIFVPNGRQMKVIPIIRVMADAEHDIAILAIGETLPALSLRPRAEVIPDGKSIALTGFPIGAVLGLFPATHSGVVAAFTPNIRPAQHSTQITQQFMTRLQQPFMIYQLDITAYPGNSGSAVYLEDSGEVFAVINKVFIKTTKESAISAPSGITYAIPIEHVYALAEANGIHL
jgi:S1-C subfamily serine protease